MAQRKNKVRRKAKAVKGGWMVRGIFVSSATVQAIMDELHDMAVEENHDDLDKIRGHVIRQPRPKDFDWGK